MLDEFFDVNVMEYGIKGGDLNLISLYYEMYGSDNNLDVKYDNEILSFPDGNGKVKSVFAPKLFVPFLNKVKEAENNKKQSFQIIETVKIKSGLERFRSRYSKNEEERI